MMDYEYEAVFRIGRLRSLLFSSGVGQRMTKNESGFRIEVSIVSLPHH